MSDKNSTINRFQYSSPSNTSISTFKKDNDTAQVRELLDIQKAIKSLDVSLVKNILRKSNFLPNTLKKKLSFALSIYSSNNPVNRLKSNTSNSSMDLNKTPSDKPKQNSSFSPLKKMDQTQSSENLLSVGPVDEKTPIREIILELLQTNADPDALTDHPLVKKDKISCLLLACIRLDLPFICELLKYKPNVNLKDQHGRNSLILLLNSVPIQAEKIESTSKVQKYDEELLLDTIRRLISAGISINDFDNQGNSPLTIAISKNLEKIVSLLLEFRANVNHKVKSNFNSTPMHIAVHIENINMVKLLLEHKPDLLLENSYGYNAIDEAVKIKASTDIYKILAEEQSLRITQMEKFKEEDKEIIEEPKPVETPDDIQVKDDIIETKREFTLLNKIQNSQVVHSELSYINSNNNTEKQQPNEETPADVKIPDGPSSQISYVLTSNSLEFNSKANAQNPAMNQNSNTIVLPNNNNENNFFYLIPKSPSTTNIQNSSTYPISQNDLNVTFNLTDRDRKYGRIKSIIESNNISANKLVMKKVEKISNLEVPINTINSNHAFNYSHIVPLGNTLTNNVQSSQNTSFTNNITSNLNTSINSMVNPLNHIYNDEIFEELQNPPILHIDLSSESKKHNFLTQYHIDEMKMKNQSQNSLVQKLEYELKSLREENSNIRNENIKLNSEIFNKDQAFNQLNEELKKTQLETEKIISGLRQSLDEKDQKIEKISNTCKLLELELEESRKGISSQHINLREQLSNSEILHNNLELENSLLQHNLINTSYTLKSKKILHEKDPELQMILDTMSYKNRREFLEKKFNCAKYNDSYIIKCLQRDILDFREYNKDQIQKIKPIQEELVFLIQEAVEEVLPDYEVKLYGSHATGLCLTWSDLDTVLVHRKGLGNVSYGNLQHLYIKLLDKPWKKTIKYVESAVVPIIKITTTEKYNSMQIDISIQDMKHYGLKCVDLVKEFMNSYEALEPLLFSLKNILKNANLNDPYTGGMSSYGLILMLVSFLQNQSDNKKSIKPNENNLGRLFLEFLWYYGLMFDHSKYVINTYRPNENDKDMNFVYNMQSNHELIIVDPLTKNNNVARSTYQFVNIKMAFMIGFVVSHEECECGCHFSKNEDAQNMDHCILKRIFNSVKRFNISSNMSSGTG